jgi:Tol biopolymer transport system component
LFTGVADAQFIPRYSVMLSLILRLSVIPLLATASAYPPAVEPAQAETLLSEIRQLTFTGKRAGEGYFSADGKKLIFQSERDPANPFFQMFVLDLESGDTTRVSPGSGKTTCGWIFPDGNHVLFASTHADTNAAAKQQSELADRAAGKQKRYSWDYDETYELWRAKTDGSELKKLSDAVGYDAEGGVSPDGQWIVFASNRHAYTEKLSAADAPLFEKQKSLLMDIYRMRSDGTEVQRLTDVRGYDGGPFYSADGKKICWRRFNEAEDRAEIWTMNADGSGQQQITKVGAMSWAPFFHPSGEYLIFTTNKHGFDNFELYLVDAAGSKPPVRVTTTAGFDGLASFSPDGKQLTWTSNRTADKTSQIFLAAWDDAAARKALGIGTESAPLAVAPAIETKAEISADDIKQHVVYLASDALEGRLTGTKGEQLATQYVADALQQYGLEPAGENGTYFQSFTFTAGVDLGNENSLASNADDPAKPLQVRRDWVPLSFSTVGKLDATEVVFAGYGMDVPAGKTASGAQEAYSSYVHADVKDKWVLLFRYLPDGLSQEQRVRFFPFSSLRNKAMTAREKGAKGIIVASGPNSKVQDQLVPLSFDASLAGSGISAISITDAVAAGWLQMAGKPLQKLQDTLDKGEFVQAFTIPGLKLSSQIDLKQEKRTGRNVLAKLPAPSPAPAVLIGAHIDHLGTGGGTDSRATSDDKSAIHHGADDNASGIAGMLEIAQWMADSVKSGSLKLERPVIFGAWSGEELGLLGSAAYTRWLAQQKGDENAKLNDKLCANLNMDMIGRLEQSVVIQGLGSSDYWNPAIERRNVAVGLSIQAQNDCFLPTDATSFYLRGVPIFNLFTGSHEDYHKPSDTADKVNYPGAAKITRLAGLIAKDLATSKEAPNYLEQKKPQETTGRGFRVYLGTIPDYAQGDVEGVKLSGVSAVGPAAKAGVLAGDVIVKLAGKDIKNIYEFTDIMAALKIGEATPLVVKRGEKLVELTITPGSRE